MNLCPIDLHLQLRVVQTAIFSCNLLQNRDAAAWVSDALPIHRLEALSAHAA